MNSRGLALISMQRTSQLGEGKMAIVAKPMRGTEIAVHVPLVLAAGANEMTLEAA